MANIITTKRLDKSRDGHGLSDMLREPEGNFETEFTLLYCDNVGQ